MMNINFKPELLAPGGDFESAIAAMEAGADAVYFGLSDFNARRRAANISPSKLNDLVNILHENNVKAYLTLNTDISQRELAEAARYYAFAKFAKLDGIIFKDFCFLLFRETLGDIPMHFSTQAAVSTSWGVRLAKKLLISRVILARELSLTELRSIAAARDGIELEIFIQGAMCFAVSGRCLLSSWMGGRSGNRGLCASPCRMEWENIENGSKARLMSMKDLSLLNHIKELSGIGISSFKIEGRLKNAEWVAEVVKIIKSCSDSEKLPDDISKLGSYAGREMTDNFFCGIRTGLIANSARPKTTEESDFSQRVKTLLKVVISETGRNLQLEISSIDNLNNEAKILFLCKKRNRGEKKNLISIEELYKMLSDKFTNFLFEFENNAESGFISAGDCLKLERAISSFLERLSKTKKELVRIELPTELLVKMKTKTNDCEIRRNSYGFEFVRITASQAEIFLKYQRELRFIVECNSVDDAKFAMSVLGNKFIAALPQVFYENDLERISSIISFCKENSVIIELNNLDSIFPALDYDLEWTAGPGLMILNSFSGEILKKLGAKFATISLEADKEKIMELIDVASIPLILYLFGRPRLMISRCDIINKEMIISERRGENLVIRKENSLTIIHPLEPFRIDLPRNLSANFAIDLVFSPDPLNEFSNWQHIKANSFNYERKLR